MAGKPGEPHWARRGGSPAPGAGPGGSRGGGRDVPPPAPQGQAMRIPTLLIALAYYFYPVSSCGNNCSLSVGFTQSSTGGSTWTAAETLAGPMQLTWLPNTFSGTMVADYVSVGFAGGKAFPVFAAAQAKTGSLFHEAVYTTTSGQVASTPGLGQITAAREGVGRDDGP